MKGSEKREVHEVHDETFILVLPEWGARSKGQRGRKKNEQLGEDSMIFSMEVGVNDKSLGTHEQILACVSVK